jgi:hypothetical protein
MHMRLPALASQLCLHAGPRFCLCMRPTQAKLQHVHVANRDALWQHLCTAQLQALLQQL